MQPFPDEGCVEPDRVSAYVRGELDAEAMRALEEHAADCARCCELLAALVKLDSLPTCVAPALAAGDSLSPTLPRLNDGVAPELAIGANIGRYTVLALL